ncbi:DoxX family membrane protein [Winogradskyella tangerina]|uniref:DoxX family membrane protein n=1 Tax=Winogradskyella tangerina TaxID=2023240 RepID=UPI000DBE6279|nr:DoxX family membrane protein [Winogradskyella tangerina]
MNSKVSMILRILLGIFVLVFGANKLYPGGFLPAPEGMSEAAGNYFGALVSSKTIILVGVVEVVAGLALIFNKYGALLAFILMSISVNAVLYHAVLDPGNIAPAIVLLLLNIVVMYGYKDKYKDLLS